MIILRFILPKLKDKTSSVNAIKLKTWSLYLFIQWLIWKLELRNFLENVNFNASNKLCINTFI